MLYGIRDENPAAGKPGHFQGLIEQPSRGSDERMAAQVLLIARLFAHHRLSGVFP